MRVFAILMLPWIVTLPTAVDAQDRYICPGNGSDLQQLRVYEIDRSNKNAFYRRFQDHAVRIMKRHDFRIIDMWESATGETIEFVYLLSWPNKDAMNSRWASFLAAQEWSDLKKKTAATSGVLGLAAAGQPMIHGHNMPAGNSRRAANRTT